MWHSEYFSESGIRHGAFAADLAYIRLGPSRRRRTNTPTVLPSCPPTLPPKQKPEGPGAPRGTHPVAPTQDSLPVTEQVEDGGPLEGDKEVTQHLATPTAKTVVRTWA